jgi:uncharacterized repeat protein (TIGR01451 family)
MNTYVKTSLFFLLLVFALPSNAQWVQEFEPPTSSKEVSAIDIYQDMFFVGARGRLFSRAPGATDWTEYDIIGFSPIMDLHVADANTIFFTTQNTLYRSQDGGLTEEALQPAIYSYQEFYYVFPICDNLLMTTGEEIRVSSSNGDSWDSFGLFSVWFEQRIVAYENEMLLYGRSNSLSYSIDCGDTWTSIYDNLMTATGPDQTLIEGVFLANGRMFVEVGDPHQLYVSDDMGETWQFAFTGFPVLETWDELLYVENVGPYYFAGTELAGLFISTDGGITWEHMIGGNGNFILTDAFISDDEYFYIGSNNGLWKYPVSELSLLEGTSTVFHDQNENGVKDPDENGIPNHLFKYGDQDAYTFSDQEGDFSILDPFNAPLTISPVPLSSYAVVTPMDAVVNAPDALPDFAVSFPTDEEDLRIHLVHGSPPRPGFETQAIINIQNVGAEIMDASVSFEFDPALAFLEADPVPSSIDGNTLSWEFDQLDILAWETIKIDFLVDVSTPLGTILTHTAELSPGSNDETPDDNISTINVEVIGSFDPNDKLVDQSTMTEAQLLAAEPIEYTIRFQNTGTAPAIFVRIEDELDPNFDLESMKILAYSHPFELELDDSGALQFIFNDINLPDSTHNEPESHGFVKFSIALHPDPGLIGTTIENTAAIFFDFNAPIITNTAETIIEVETSAVSASGSTLVVEAFPNPTSGVIRIHIHPAQKTNGALLRIYNSLGQLIWQGPYQTEVDLTGFGEGIFLLEIGGVTKKIALWP